MSAVLRPDPETRRRLRDARPSTSFPKERALTLLSPLEGEILSICLNAPEDPRDVGILPALLAAELLGDAPKPDP